jgi:hypothetical protein
MLASTASFNGDNVRLDLAIDRAAAEPIGDGFRGNIGRFAKALGIAGLDLVPPWRPLTVCDRWFSG